MKGRSRTTAVDAPDRDRPPPAGHRRPDRARVAVMVLLLARFGTAVAGGAERVPAWLESAVARPVPESARGARAFVLLRVGSVSLEPTGRATVQERFAVRVLARGGRSDAVARVVYRSDGGRVRDLQAWLLTPSGAWIRYGRERAVDLALVGDDIYNEARVLVISAAADADSGAVFAFESFSERQEPFAQFEWAFQDRLPTARSRFSLTLPPGWQVSSRTFNHARVDSVHDGPAIAWEVRDLPEIPEEPSAPSSEGFVPRLGVTCVPPPEVEAARLPSFRTWPEVSRWLARLNEVPGVPTPEVEARARNLVARARTRRDSVSSVARFVQRVRYASIQMGLSRGGGFRAHPAGEVMAKSYGDCKDKANLMRTMLRSLAVPSWLVAVYSGDARYVREDWPSPQQFNHCILAVRAWDGEAGLPRVEEAGRGGLILFDPTDPSTPLGDLPLGVQGSPALLISEDGGDLIRLPAAPPHHNLLRRRVRLNLSPEGGVQGRIEEESSGQSAAFERRLVGEQSPGRYRETIRRWLWRSAGAATVGSVDFAADSLQGRFTLRVGFHARQWGQLAARGLLVFRPSFSDRRAPELLVSEDRKMPIVLQPLALQESVFVSLPDGYTLDEIPEPVQITTPFGDYMGEAVVRGSELVCTRRITVRGDLLPPESFPAVRDFLARVRAAEHSPVVLVRK